ncbi:hypothetical protein AB0451_23945 [Streptomyces sp. NPDC052000]|uniref:hypothetical protein n=1 Tax=Streptomyces sp. NPDC052000 TaxID=3155676 RepID=UPI00344E4F39
MLGPHSDLPRKAYWLLFLDPVRIIGLWLAFLLLQLLMGLYAFSVWTENGRARCGACRCSSSSTGS